LSFTLLVFFSQKKKKMEIKEERKILNEEKLENDVQLSSKGT
jgi:hypothetical protein